MNSIKVAIIGCGTVGGGVAQILTELDSKISSRSHNPIVLKKIVELDAPTAAERFKLPLNLFCGDGKKLTKDESNTYINEIIRSKDIDLVVETIGGSGDFVYNLATAVCESGKHLVTANKALLATRGQKIFEIAQQKNVYIGYEAAVCGAIPIIKTIKESFTGDDVISISGIMNGTSNYILSSMQNKGLTFLEALKLAQKKGYAEADPTLDINGHDAGHKLLILINLAFGSNIEMKQLPIQGIEQISKEDIDFAQEIDCNIKLICYAQRNNGNIYATVTPMMVKKSNLLAQINGATNAVRITNRYSGEHVLIGKGAGSLETASSIVADIVFIARYSSINQSRFSTENLIFTDARHFEFPYIITFETIDKPGITGLVTTSIGKHDINIDTVSHNRHNRNNATFSIATMPCTLEQIESVIQDIRDAGSRILLEQPRIIPILY
jgi:homoserine dehydrogenase